MRLPEMTPLQFVAVSFLFDGPKSASELRRRLCRSQGRRNRSSFCTLMRRLVEVGYVKGSAIGAGNVHECTYQVTDLGLMMWKAAREFYQGFSPPPPDLEVVTTDLVKYADHHPKKRKALLVRDVTRELMRAFDARFGR